MSNITKSYHRVITASDIDSDFEYNFDLNPFTYLLDGILFLIAVPFSLLSRLLKNNSDRLHRIQRDQAFRRTFKGPACILK